MRCEEAQITWPDLRLVQESWRIFGAVLLVDDHFSQSCGLQLAYADAKEAAQKGARADSTTPLGVFLVAVGALVGTLSYLMGIVPMVAFGLASFIIGIMILFLDSGSIASSIATDSSLPLLLNIENLLEDLDVDEKGIYIPYSGLGVSPKVFVPLAITAATKKPPLGLIQSRRIFVTVGNGPEDRGLLLEAPGSGILVAMERSLRVDLAKIQLDDLRDHLDSGFKALGIAKIGSVELGEADIRIKIELSAPIDLEAKLMTLAPLLSTRIGTPLASATAAAISKTTKKYVTITSAVLDLSNREMRMHLSLTA